MQTERRAGEAGSALVIAVFVLAILSVMAMALIAMGENDLKMGRADLRGKRTFYVAEAGIDHGRLSLFDANGSGSFDDELLAAAGGTADGIELDLDALAPVYDAAGILTSFSAGHGDDVPLMGATAFGEGSYTVFLTNDPVDGVSTTTDTNGRVMLTAVGGTPGRSLETVQAIVEYDPLFNPPKAGVAMIGDNPSWTPGSSNAKMYSGDDCAGAGEPGVFVPAVGTISQTAADDIVTQSGNPTYEAGGLPATDTIADLNDTSHPGVSEPLDGMWQNCQQLHDFVEFLRTKAKTLCPTSICVLPSPALDNFIFVDDDFTMGPADGAGLIVVTGTLTLLGNFGWDGIVMAVGEGVVQRSGGGAEEILGTTIVADIAGPDNVYGNSDDCSSGFEPPIWDTSGGGNGTVAYCGAFLAGAIPHDVYRLVEFLQR